MTPEKKKTEIENHREEKAAIEQKKERQKEKQRQIVKQKQQKQPK